MLLKAHCNWASAQASSPRMHMMIMPNEAKEERCIWDLYQCREAAEDFRGYRDFQVDQACREGRGYQVEGLGDFRERPGARREE